MTLVGVGALVPGLPSLLTNLIHQGNKSSARSSNPRRRGFIARHAGAFRRHALQSTSLGDGGAAGRLGASFGGIPAWLTVALEFGDDVARALSLSGAGADVTSGVGVGGTPEEALAAFRAPCSPLEEYTSG